MRITIVLIGLLSALPLLSSGARAQTAGAAAPTPSDFDSSALLPKNLILPVKLNIPSNTRIDVTGWRKKPLPPIPPSQMNNPCFLWDDALDSAVIESDQENVHAIFHWHAGHTSEAFIIRGACFRLLSLATPNAVTETGSELDFWINRTDPTEGGRGNFPDISSYSPSNFAGKASLNGNDVFVFTLGGKKPGVTAYPEGSSICLDAKTLSPVRVDDGTFIFMFAYSPDPNVQINPQGAYLQAIQTQFGHYP